MVTIGIIEPVGGHGGMDYYDYGLAYGLGQNKVSVLLYTCDETNIRTYLNVRTMLVFKNMWKSGFVIKSLRYLYGHFKAFKHLKEQKSSIAHLHFFTFRSIDFLCLLIGKLFGHKIVVTIHDVNAFDKSGNISMAKLCYKLIDHVIVHNQFSYNELMDKYKPPKPVAIIPHGNYIPFISQSSMPPSGSTKFTILFFGQIKEVKGVDLLLKALSLSLKKGYKIKLILAGRPWKADIGYYQSLIENLNLQSDVETNFSYIADEHVLAYYSRSDLVVLPYKEIYQSGAILLAMSYGKPVLCSNLTAFTNIINHQENGLLFESENPESLSKQLNFAHDNRNILDTLAKAASKTVKEDFDWIKIGMKTKETYFGLIK
jgi:D-inositol-3-phosphate glycosyltransferase